MESDFIIVNDISLAALLKNTLEATGKRDPRFKFADYKKFTREELSTITKLKLENNSFEDISALEQCINLKQLEIRSVNAKEVSTNLSAEAKANYQLRKNKITDYSVINKLKKLQFLTIEYQDNLVTLDLSGMSELTGVNINHNSNLTEIKGLDSLTDLSELVLLKNKINKAFDISALAKRNLPNMVLDFDIYPVLLKQYPDLQDIMKEYTKLGGSFKWAENISNIKTNEISYMMMGKMDVKAKEILDSIIAPNYSDMEKICAIYAYIIQNVKYDYEALEASKNKELRKQFAQTRGNMSETLNSTLNKKQSSYNAILEGRSVCEGYSNMMHYLLKSINIDSTTCSCSSFINKSVVGADSNHSVIRVSINGDWYYFDPTWDALNFKKNKSLSHFFKTKEEFSESHSLSLSEDEILSSIKKIYTNDELSKMLSRVIFDRDNGKNKQLNDEIHREQEKEEKHQATLFQIEQIIGKRITSVSGYAISPEKYDGIPYEELKDTSNLRKEQGEIFTKIDELWMNGEIDPKTRAEMKMALITEYDKMVVKAPRPSVSTANPTNSTPTNYGYYQTQQQNSKIKSTDGECRRQHNNDSISNNEKSDFDRKQDKQKKKEAILPVKNADKEKLVEQRQNIRRQQYAEKIQAMGLEPQNLTFEEIIRQQEIIERMKKQEVEIEEIEHHGMEM